MKIIRKRENKIVTHAGDYLHLTDSGLKANGSWMPMLNTVTCDEIQVDSLLPLTGSEGMAFGVAVQENYAANQDNARQHKDAVNILGSVLDVKNYDYSTGWS